MIGELHSALGSDNSDPAFSPDEPSMEALSILTADVDEQIERVFLDLPETTATEPILGRGQDVREKLARALARQRRRARSSAPTATCTSARRCSATAAGSCSTSRASRRGRCRSGA